MVHSPYTLFFGDAFMAAHAAIGIMLAAFAWWLLPRAVVVRTIFILAIGVVVTAPMLGDFLRGFGSKTTPLEVERDALLISSCLVFGAVLMLRRFLIAFAALCVAAFLLKLQGWLDDSMAEMCALHLVWIGVALGLVRRKADREPQATSTRTYGQHDIVIFLVATLAASLASIFVLSRADGSADEWAYTWQAATFAKLHIYGTPPACEPAFQNFYVFSSLGRLFAQYTPGWPYFMTPFVMFNAAWLAGPVSHGLMAVGVARVARSATRLDTFNSPARVADAGWVAGLVATFGTTILLVGASRYSHTFVAALFAWSIEATLVLTTNPNLATRLQWRWGIVMGSCVALMGATRPADGAMLSMGLFFYCVYCLVRRRVRLRSLAGTLAGFAFWGLLTLVVLRVQLGTWFTTGYSLDKVIHPWNVTKYGWPRPSEWKFALPLATGSYAWFPCSLAIGFAGIVSLRRRATGIIVMMFVSMIAFDTYYQYIDLARGVDWGYGPRYETPFVVPMAVGMGVALAPLVEAARRRVAARSALQSGGPLAIVVCAMALTLVRLWPLLYPGVYAHVHQHDSLNERIRELGIHNAVVMTQVGATGFDPLDLTENLPIDLYPNQDVLIAVERKPEFTRCIRTSFAGRQVYRAAGNPVVVSPY